MKKARARSKLRTPAQARAWLRQCGMTHKQFADQQNLSRSVVRKLLYGTSKGHYGKAHLAAVALGMKPAADGADAKGEVRA